MLLRRLESIISDLGDEMYKAYSWVRSSGNLGFYLLWHRMHLIVGIWYFVLDMVNAMESFLISNGIVKKYGDLDVSKVKYLAVVVDSEEARDTLKVLELLQWLAAIGLTNLCLYDSEGVLKKSKDALTLWLKTEKMSNETTITEPLLKPKHKSLEVISFSDSRIAVAKAANLILENYYSSTEKPDLTESDMTDALQAIGHGGPEPDLMFIYGPARSHLGFPAWRIRYTEMVHMGPLTSMRFGSLVKAIHKFTMVHQNYVK